MSEQPRRLIDLVWNPELEAAEAPLLLMHRARVVVLAIFFLGVWLIPALLIGAAVLHSRVLGATSLLLISVMMGANAVVHAARIWLVFRIGRWTGWNRKPVPRHERPLEFWSWTAFHLLVLIVLAAGPVLLIRLAADLLLR